MATSDVLEVATPDAYHQSTGNDRNEANHQLKEIKPLPHNTEQGLAVLQLDPWLQCVSSALHHRQQLYLSLRHRIESVHSSLAQFAEPYQMGFKVDPVTRILRYREWAPNVQAAYLMGDFNQWNRASHPMWRDGFGVWQLDLNPVQGQLAIPHGSKVKISMIGPNGERIERIPAWIERAEQDLTKSSMFEGVFWYPPEAYVWQHSSPVIPNSLRIYEAHIGICTSEGRIASYNDFRVSVLPRIHRLGYNCIQLMAIMEHAYYASFGYQVTQFFAISSRFGTPEELKALIDTAHGMGILVLLDVVHSHASNNVLDGLNQFDGSDHLYFHEGERGRHSLWDSRLFNYGHWEVLRFLMSNLRYFKECYRFDGFRFDGVTSMLYRHHGIAYGFSGNYQEYFNEWVDEEACVYFKLANAMLHETYENVVTIAEDVSGMPTLCRPVSEGGLGFDYRLGMALPDMWIKILKCCRDEDWNLNEIVNVLMNRRYKERTVAYAESHDQALVGDKTLAFWLMDKEMYTEMSLLRPLTGIIDRGMALHKMIRLVTMALGGEAWLNFMGNEFGHPEWLDFPREGNQNSFHYARRQFHLADDKLLRYHQLEAFDEAMQHLDMKFAFLSSEHCYVTLKHESDKVLVFERGDLVFLFNFHTSQSFVDYKVGVEWPGVYRAVLCSDDVAFGGHGRVDCGETSSGYLAIEEPWCNRKCWIQVYLPCRVVLVLSKQR